MFDEPLLNSLQGTMATIDPYSVKREAITEYRLDLIEERLIKLESVLDSLESGTVNEHRPQNAL